MTQEELDKILELHKKWLCGEPDGVHADLTNSDLTNVNLKGADLSNANLSCANLKGADLSRANLSCANLKGADLSNANLSKANLSDADLSNANLYGVDLSDADLRFANLKNADLKEAMLDYSCLPLWCGSLKAEFDDRQLKQIAYHLVKAGLQSKNAAEEVKQELSKLIDFANGFHRIDECGKIEWGKE